MGFVDDHAPRWLIAPCPEPETAALATRLGLSRTTAEVLVRRGLADPDAARRFLTAGRRPDRPGRAAPAPRPSFG